MQMCHMRSSFGMRGVETTHGLICSRIILSTGSPLVSMFTLPKLFLNMITDTSNFGRSWYQNSVHSLDVASFGSIMTCILLSPPDPNFFSSMCSLYHGLPYCPVPPSTRHITPYCMASYWPVFVQLARTRQFGAFWVVPIVNWYSFESKHRW